MANDLKPYLLPRPGTVVMDAWQLFDTEWAPLPDEFEGWDTGTDLLIRRTVGLDPERFRAETGLNPEQAVITISWTSSTSGMKDATAPFALPRDGQALIEARLLGLRIGGTVEIRTTLCLSSPGPSETAAVALVVGSVLVEDRQNVVLDRGAQLFAVDAIDFALTRLPPDASWHLETSGDLAAPFFSNFRVLVNSRDTELARAVTRGNRERRQQVLLDELESGVAALLSETALMLQEELQEGGEWPPDSIGDVLTRTLGVWPSTPPLPGPGDLALFRTKIAAAVRATGKGRQFT